MAFPAVASVTQSANVANSVNSALVMPATVNAGDLLISFICSDSPAVSHTWPSPWVELKDENVGSPVAAVATIGYKIADGTEDGATVNVTHTSEQSEHLTIRITGWHGTTPPEVSTVVGANSGNGDPDSLTASWGSADNLWIACVFTDASTGTANVTAWPTGFTDNRTENSGGTSSGNVAVCTMNDATATKVPSAFTNRTEQWRAYTLAVRPSGPAATSLVLPNVDPAMHFLLVR